MFDNFFWDDVDEEAHVFVVGEGDAVIKIFYVDATKTAVGGGDGAVE